MPKRKFTAEELKAKNADKVLHIPVYYADSAVRSARLRKLREMMGLTIVEFAAQLGTTPWYHKVITYGRRNCPISQVYLAERIYQGFRQKQNRARAKEERRLAGIVDLPEPAEFVPPDNPELKTQVITMYIRGVDEPEIARELALSPETVQYWISSIV